MRRHSMWKTLLGSVMAGAIILSGASVSAFAAEEEILVLSEDAAQETDAPETVDEQDIPEEAITSDEIIPDEESEAALEASADDTVLSEGLEGLIEDQDLAANEEDSITLTLHAGDGSFIQDEHPDWTTVSFSTDIDIYFCDIMNECSELVPPREGQALAGWMNANNEIILSRFDDDYEWFYCDRDMDLYAIWVDVVTITLYPNGGSWDEEDEGESGPMTQIVEKGSRIDCYDLSRPEGDGYFMGWARDEEGNDLVLPVDYDDERPTILADGPMTLYAIWDEAAVITFDPTDGYWWYDDDDEEDPYYREPDECKVRKGMKIGASYSQIPVHDTAAFAGWEDESLKKEAGG